MKKEKNSLPTSPVVSHVSVAVFTEPRADEGPQATGGDHVSDENSRYGGLQEDTEVENGPEHVYHSVHSPPRLASHHLPYIPMDTFSSSFLTSSVTLDYSPPDMYAILSLSLGPSTRLQDRTFLLRLFVMTFLPSQHYFCAYYISA